MYTSYILGNRVNFLRFPVKKNWRFSDLRPVLRHAFFLAVTDTRDYERARLEITCYFLKLISSSFDVPVAS